MTWITRHYPITPVAKPRMTRRDKWLRPPRPCVAKYWAFRDEVRWRKVELPKEGATVIFILPMPGSWSKAKRRRMAGTKHEQTPDLSNLIKALEDACYTDDKSIWHYDGQLKLWGVEGKIVIINRKGGSK